MGSRLSSVYFVYDIYYEDLEGDMIFFIVRGDHTKLSMERCGEVDEETENLGTSLARSTT